MRAWRDAGADPQGKLRASYRLVSVFAQDQVAELPPLATPGPLTAPIAEIRGDSHERLPGALVSLAHEIGYRMRSTYGQPAVPAGQSGTDGVVVSAANAQRTAGSRPDGPAIGADRVGPARGPGPAFVELRARTRP